MKNIFFIINILLSIYSSAQEVKVYQFSEDILNIIKKDTVPWKNQTGATNLSFNNYYFEALRVWEANNLKKQLNEEQDSLFFINSTKVNAKQYIVEKAKNFEILIINEAHHVPMHRTFTASLLEELYNNGYRYLGLEALFDHEINIRKYAVLESGYYTKEPEFGNLIAKAIKIGFTLFPYEATKGKNGKEREIEQAKNIENFLAKNKKGKTLILCGYAHAFENDYKPWEKAMAGRIKEFMKIDPLTIDQTLFIEKSDTSYNHIFTKLNHLNTPIVLQNNNEIFNGNHNQKQTDIVVIHPKTKFINNRPDWFTFNKKEHLISKSKNKNYDSILVLAYRTNENIEIAIPADVIEITKFKKDRSLYLQTGEYIIVIKNKNYDTLTTYKIKI